MAFIFSNLSLGFYYYITFFVIFIDLLLMIIGSGLVFGFLLGSFSNLYYKR